MLGRKRIGMPLERLRAATPAGALREGEIDHHDRVRLTMPIRPDHADEAHC